MKKQSTQKMKGKKRQRKILTAAVVVALLIVIGGTFAWFTSKDEVTNHLAADGKYGVSITESFEPTDNWVPGQEIKKDVKSVNTGNIDAFVRVNLASKLTVKKYDTTEEEPDTADSTYVVLSEEEAIALQAGGYRYSPDTEEKWEKIESSTLAPESGLNVFRRKISTEGTTTTYEYTGYYYTDGNYYAVEINGTEDTGFLDGTKYLIVKDAEIKDDNLTISYEKAKTDNKIVVTYNSGTEDTTDDDLIINIKLADNWQDNWTLDDADSPEYFFYNKVLKPGAETESLVTALELDESVSNEAYKSFEYDLTVGLESVQATGKPFEVDGEQHYNGTEAVNSSNWSMLAETKEKSFEVTWKKN